MFTGSLSTMSFGWWFSLYSLCNTFPEWRMVHHSAFLLQLHNRVQIPHTTANDYTLENHFTWLFLGGGHHWVPASNLMTDSLGHLNTRTTSFLLSGLCFAICGAHQWQHVLVFNWIIVSAFNAFVLFNAVGPTRAFGDSIPCVQRWGYIHASDVFFCCGNFHSFCNLYNTVHIKCRYGNYFRHGQTWGSL